jgi:hypothetical protein
MFENKKKAVTSTDFEWLFWFCGFGWDAVCHKSGYEFMGEAEARSLDDVHR